MSGIFASQLANFTSPTGNTNSFVTHNKQNNGLVLEDGTFDGFYVKVIPTLNQVEIRFSDSLQNRGDGFIGGGYEKWGSAFYYFSLDSTNPQTIIIPANPNPTVLYLLLVWECDFDTTNPPELKLINGTTLTDPDLDAWELANPNKRRLPICRIERTNTVLVQNNIKMSGATTYNLAKSVRPLATFRAGAVKVMTLAERNAASWQPGGLAIVTAPLDINNQFFVNISTTPTALWRQIVLLGILASQWVLLIPKALGTAITATTTNLLENEGIGSFTLPANFWAIGTVLEITETTEFGGITVTSTPQLIQTNNFLINSLNLFSNTFTVNHPATFGISVPIIGRTKKTVIQCVAVTSTTAQLQITTQNLANVLNASPVVFVTTSTTTLQTITQNIPMVISTNFVRTATSGWTSPVNNLTVFTIEKQQ